MKLFSNDDELKTILLELIGVNKGIVGKLGDMEKRIRNIENAVGAASINDIVLIDNIKLASNGEGKTS